MNQREAVMTDRFNQLTPAEDERLSLLVEECGEVLQIIGKIKRHGYESYNPFDENKTTNRKLLEKELGDLMFSINLLWNRGDVDALEVNKHEINKKYSVDPYLHHNSIEDKE